jgi:hypothetical protein
MRLSSGSSADLAGMTYTEFFQNLSYHRVFPFVSELPDLESDHIAL